jgi:hypothetical protein
MRLKFYETSIVARILNFIPALFILFTVFLPAAGKSQCNNTTPYGTANAPAPTMTSYIYCQYAGEYGTWNGLVAAGQYTVSSTMATDYLTVRQGTPGGPVLASGVSPLSINPATGGTYYIHCNSNVLCGVSSSCRDISMTCVSASGPLPPNDDCANAIAIAVPGSASASTISATPDGAAPTCITSNDGANGVWYTVNGNGNSYMASLCGSGWDSKLFVYTGSCSSFTCVTGDDDNGPGCSSTDASVSWCTTTGTLYYIFVTGYSTNSGAFTLNVTETAIPVPTVSPSSPTMCSGGSITLTASGSTTYEWNPGFMSGSSITVSPASTTTYTVTGTDGMTGCSRTATTTVTVDPAPTVSATASNSTVCSGSNVTLTGSGAATYNWMPGSLSGSPVTVNPSSTTTYTIVGSTSAGCTDTAFVAVTVNPSPSVTATASNATICSGSNTTLTASGGSTYNWMPGALTGTSISVAPTSTTTYTVTGTSSTGCTNTATVTVAVTPGPVISATASANPVCSGSPCTLSGSGGNSYSWTNSVTDNVPFTPAATTTYTVTGTDANSCTATATITVTVNSPPAVAVSFPIDTVCLNAGSWPLSGESPAGGTWSGTGVSGSSFDPAVSGAGYNPITYSYTDANNCSAAVTDSLYVEVCTGIAAAEAVKSVQLFPNPNNGEFTLMIPKDFGDANVLIFDMTGKLVYSIDQSLPAGLPVEIDFNPASTGLYLVIIRSARFEQELRIQVVD